MFRYEDTEGEPLPEAPEVGYVTGDTLDGAWDGLADLVARPGHQLTAEPEDDAETRGHTDFTNRIVNIDPRHDDAERAHVLVHQLGARPLRPRERRDVSRAQRETEAESVAFIVCTTLGLHLGDPDTITAAQAAIHTAARELLADLEDYPDKDESDAVHV